MPKRVLGIAAALAGAVLVVSSSGSIGSGLPRALETADLRGELIAAHDAVIDARVAIDIVDFREARRLLEEARRLLGRADERLNSLGWNDQGTEVRAALATLDEAQRLVGQLDRRDSRSGLVPGRFALAATAGAAAVSR